MRTRFINPVVRHALMLLAIPLTLSGTGYALFSQQLSVAGTATKPAYSRSQKLSISYTRGVTQSGGSSVYSIPVTITNNGTKAVTAWRSEFSLPSDFSAVSCTNASCTQSNGINVAVNTASNGTIAAGGSVSYTFTFTSAEQNYLFTSIAISGTPAIVYQNVPGLTVTPTAGARSGFLLNYSYPRTYVVNNNSGTRVLNWRITIPWNNADTVSSMDATVDYVITTNLLTIYSKQAMETGTSFQFNATYSSSNANRTFSGTAIEGDI